MPWVPYNDGSTIGQFGTENGVIVCDEEYDREARITLERNTQHAPLSITCGVYGWTYHTRFFSSEAEAKADYDLMKDGLAAIVAVIPFLSDVE